MVPSHEILGSTLPTAELTPDVTAERAVDPCLFFAFAAHRPLLAPFRHKLTHLERVVIGRGKNNAVTTEPLDGPRSLRVNLPDPAVSSTHAHLVRMLGRWALEDMGSRNGTLRNGVRVERVLLEDNDLIECGQTFFSFRSALVIDDNDPTPPLSPGSAGSLLTSTLQPALARDLARLARLAPTQVSVLILGESGTGKELAARALHLLSGRSGPFEAVNCGALPGSLLEAELFGHRKGSFSGAHEDRPGRIRSAHRGTLLLDEIGDLPLSSQVAFLRVLEERAVVPVGGGRPEPVDLRLCSATHRSLDELVAEGKFRGDLLSRLSGFTLHLPPLRERREDLGSIVASLLRRLTGERADAFSFTREAARALFLYTWPLNIRELLKCLEPAVVLADNGAIQLDHLPLGLRQASTHSSSDVIRSTSSLSTTAPPATPVTPDLESDDNRRAVLIALDAEHNGNVSAIARVLGRDRALIRRWLKRYGIRK